MAAVTAGSEVPAMTAVTAHVHQDHAAEQPRVEHGRKRHDAGDDKRAGNDPDRQSGQEPAGANRRRPRTTVRRYRSADAMGRLVVRMNCHDRLASSAIEGLGMERARRAAMSRAMARSAIPSPINWAVLSPNRTAGSSRI